MFQTENYAALKSGVIFVMTDHKFSANGEILLFFNNGISQAKPLNTALLILHFGVEDMEINDNIIYKNPLSHINIDRSINSVEYFSFNDLMNDARFNEFMNDITHNNDEIELNLIRNKAYREAVIISLNLSRKNNAVIEMLGEEQKTFGGNKLFYLNEMFDKILVAAVHGGMEGKLNMVINRLNKINEKITRINLRIKRENLEIYLKRQPIKDRKDSIVNMINRNLKV